MSYRRLLERALPYLAICTCLAAAPGGGKTTPNASSNWLDTLWNRPVPLWSLLPQPEAPTVKSSPSQATCAVEPLPAIDDPEALAFEKRASPDTEGLIPAMARALWRFQQLVRLAGGTFELKSAYRPPSYQAHLQAVWLKWILELHDNREPGCQMLRAQVGEEFAGHRLLERQKPVTASDHTRGLAFDAAVVLPRVNQLKKRGVSLDRLARLAGIQRPDILHDPVHFKLVIGRGRRRT